jgi:hypothetical protein
MIGFARIRFALRLMATEDAPFGCLVISCLLAESQIFVRTWVKILFAVSG